MRIVMTFKVRDEEDILEANLRYHCARGVDFFIATDNGSRDGTRELLARYEEAGLARVIEEPADEMNSHGHEWLTRMARLAATEHEADWVIHNDADEFWWPLSGSLRDALAQIPEEFGVVYAPRVEFVGRPDGPGSVFERLNVREAAGTLRPKVAHRARPDVAVLHRGGHDVAIEPESGDLRDGLRPPGRAVLRGAREHSAGGAGLVPAPEWPIRILHFPIRSFAQYRHRVELGLASFPEQGSWAKLGQALEAGELEAIYAELVTGDEELRAGLGSGELVTDNRLRDYLLLCPDPLADGPRVVEAPAPDPDVLAAERAELARDAMATLARNARMFEVRLDQTRSRIRQLVEKTEAKAQLAKEMRAERRKAKRRQDKIRKLERKQAKLRQRLQAERRRPWNRARRAAGRLLRRG